MIDIPKGHRGTTASGVLSHGNFSLIYPSVMNEADAEFVCGLMDMIKDDIHNIVQKRRDAIATAFSWAGDASTC